MNNTTKRQKRTDFIVPISFGLSIGSVIGLLAYIQDWI